MKELFSKDSHIRPFILVAILLGSIGISLFYGVDSVEGVPVLPVYGGITSGCNQCVSFCGGDIATACVVTGVRPGRVMVDPHPGVSWTPVSPITIPGIFLYYQLREGVWWLGGGTPGGSCDIPAPHSGCIGFTITITSLYNGSSLGVGPIGTI